MRRFALSKYHIVLLALLFSAVVFVAVAHAQEAGAAGDAGATPQSQPASIVVVFRLVMGHLVDPVLWTIAVLSIIALTLIIQGFIRNCALVMLPEPSNNQIRELNRGKRNSRS